jgi:N-acetylglutamate synthase
MSIVFAEMTIDDYDQVVALWEGTEGIGMDDDVDSRAGIGSYLLRNPGLCFAARDGNEVIGAVLCGHDGRRGYLHHLAVATSHRRQGLGKALVEKCITALRAAGINKCNILVFEDNEDGLGFWKADGWSARHDLHFLQKWTGTPGKTRRSC